MIEIEKIGKLMYINIYEEGNLITLPEYVYNDLVDAILKYEKDKEFKL